MNRVQLVQSLPVAELVVLPAGVTQHPIAEFEFGVVGSHYRADGAAYHGLSDLYTGRIGVGFTNTTAHVRVKRQVECP